MAVSAAHAADFTTWSKRMEITFPGYPVGYDDLTNFPALVVLTDGSNGVDFVDFENGAADLRFTAADASTELSYEIDTWHDVNSNSYVWVQLPLLDTTTTIYAYWGKSGETAPAYTTNGATWNSSYSLVSHDGGITDSTTNSNSGSNNGTTAVTAFTGTGRSFNGTGAYIDLGNDPSLINLTEDLTLLAWVKRSSGAGDSDYTILTCASEGYSDFPFHWVIQPDQNHTRLNQSFGVSGIPLDSTTNGIPTEGQWELATVTRTKSNTNFTAAFFIDGKWINTTNATIEGTNGGNAHALVGRDASQYYEGDIDEIRISSSARSSDWIWATYMSMASNRQFTAYADADFPNPDSPRISTEMATNVTTTSAFLNGTLSSTGTSATVAFVYWGETDGETNATQWAHTNAFTAPQSVGPLTTSVALDAGKEYFYRYAASNDSWLVWAEESEYLMTAGISVSVNPVAISENGETATFHFTREASVTSRAVTVSYEIGGDAVNGSDYAPLTELSIVIPAGDTNATVEVTSILDYHVNSDETLELTVLEEGNYTVGTPSNAVLTITNAVLSGMAIYSATNGYWDAGSTWVGGGVPTPADHVVITNGCTVTIRDNTSHLLQSLTIETNGVLTHLANGTTAQGELYKVILDVATDLTIDLGGQINVDGRGYRSGYGPGNSGGQFCAAGHGGMGGYHNSYQYPGTTYGSVTVPTNCGSGGGYSPGGGAVVLRVGGQTALNGEILARGLANSYPGSGGAVFLTTATLSGSGIVNVGLTAGGNVASSGGGRIAVILTQGNAFADVTLLAASASAGHQAGSPGTIYTQTQDQGPNHGTLLVDAKGIVSGALSSVLISPAVTDTSVGTFVITNTAKLKLTNQVLTVHGDWENTATFLGLDGSTVVLGGTNTATITGHNTFFNLVCTNAGKVLSFEDGKTNAADGTLTLANATLDSTSGSASWYLNASAFTHSISNVTVGRSDALGGANIPAYDSDDQGGNENWTFIASGTAKNTWTGAVDTDWNNGANWGLARTTVPTDAVIIPGSCTHYPLLDIDKQIFSLAISNGASMSLNGCDLIVDENTQVAGTLTAVGSETLTLSGNLDYSGGVFVPSNSTVLLAGSGTQAVVSAGNAFHALTVDNNGGQVTFADALTAAEFVNVGTPVTFGDAVTVPAFRNESGSLVFTGIVATVTFTNQSGDLTFHDNFSAQEFYCAPGDMDLVFEAGKTCTLGDFRLYGHFGAPIRLRSSVDSSPWYLNVTNAAKVHHVDVRDSNAAAGQTIRPAASTDSGNNPNWDFSATWQTWQGSVSAVFTNANNWSPSVAPDQNRCLLIEGNYQNAPILSGVSTAAQVIVGGYTSATLTVNGHLTTLEDVDILLDGTLTHSANASTEANKLYLTVGSNLTVHGQINVDGRGYSNSQGPGLGGYASGAGYGGMGGYHNSFQNPGTTYGSVTAPTNCGSGGPNSAGGGAVILRVVGCTALYGNILARGNNGQYPGSGGGVFLTTATLTGDGLINASACENLNVATGGGGRIAVILTNGNDFADVTLRATSATAAHQAGSAGTIYTETLDQGPGHGTLLIDAHSIVAGPISTTLINDQVIDATVGTVSLKNQAKLKIATNQLLTVYGSWSNAASFVAASNSTVNFASPVSATIKANNTFYNLTAGADGKTMLFEAGKTNTVNGMLILKDKTTLLSTQDGTQWWLTLSTATGSQEIGGVTVKDSNAILGQVLRAGTGAMDLKNNENWWMPPRGLLFMVR